MESYSKPVKNFLFPFLLLVILAAGGSALTSCASGDTEQTTGSSYRLLGYVLGDHKIEVEPSHASLHTHINYAFANVTPEGKVVLEQEHDSTNLARLHDLKHTNPDLKILLSVGGWSWSDYFSDAALTEESRSRFARTAVQLVAQHKLDGIDIDWEYPGQQGQDNIYRAADKNNFTLLLKKVRHHLDQYSKKDKQDDSYLLTIAAGADTDYLANTNLEKAHQYLDFINLMTYDFHGSWTDHTGHHSNLYHPPGMTDEHSAHASVQRVINAGVPPHKIVLGVPFYGRGWQGVKDKNKGQYQTYSQSLDGFSYDTLVHHFIDQRGFGRYWAPSAKVPYLWYSDSTIFITYEDKQSLRHKTDYVKDKNLGGLMYWEYTNDADGELLHTLHKYLFSENCPRYRPSPPHQKPL